MVHKKMFTAKFNTFSKLFVYFFQTQTVKRARQKMECNLQLKTLQKLKIGFELTPILISGSD